MVRFPDQQFNRTLRALIMVQKSFPMGLFLTRAAEIWIEDLDKQILPGQFQSNLKTRNDDGPSGNHENKGVVND